jgi:hypothetical protein
MRQLIWEKYFKGKSAAWTAVFTGVLVVFTFLMYRVADETNETSRTTQRAFMNFAASTAGVRYSKSGDMVSQEVLLNWANSGTTPAKDAVSRVSVQAWRTDLPDGFAFPDVGDSQRVMLTFGPKDVTGIPVAVPLQDLRDAWEGKAKIFFWGWIVYRDIFPDSPERLTQFCTQMHQLTIFPGDNTPRPVTANHIGRSDVNLGWKVKPCPVHNCYDEDCPDYAERIKHARR